MKRWEKEYNKVAEILNRATVWYDGVVTIQREDVSEIARLAYGFKYNGGNVYVTTTLDLNVCEFASKHDTYQFAAYVIGVLRREYGEEAA